MNQGRGSCKALLRSAAIFLLAAVAGLALDPGSAATNFLRTDFTVESGLPSNVVNAIVQTRNGFLWVGTGAGLVRFNGRRFTPIYFRSPRPAPQGTVQALAEGPDGDLWVGTGSGLVRIARPALDFYDRSLSTSYHPGTGPGDDIKCLRFAENGQLWVGTNAGLYRFSRGTFTYILPGVVSQIEQGVGSHLFIVKDGSFVDWDGKDIVQHKDLAARLSVHDDQFFDVMRDRQGSIWFGTLGGLAKSAGGHFTRFPGYGNFGKNALRAEKLYQDDQGTIWAQFAGALFRVSASTPELIVRTTTRAIYSDRDGDLWVGTNGDGLLRFKDRLVRMFTSADGLPNNTTMTVLVRRDKSLWVGNNCAGLSVLDHSHFRVYAEKEGLANSCVWALAEDKNDALWVGTWGGGLFRYANGRFTQFSTAQGLPGAIVRGIQVARDNSLWIATDNGVSHMQDGRFRNYKMADGLSSNQVAAVYQDHQGNLWVGTSAGIDRLVKNRFTPVASTIEMSDSRSMNFGEDASGNLYVMGAPRGVNLISGNQLVEIDTELDLLEMLPFHKQIWFSGRNGIFRFPAAVLKRIDRERDLPIDYTSFGVADGMNSIQCSVGIPNMAVSEDGKLWVATLKGLAELDLHRLSSANDRPSVFVSEVTVGRTKQNAGKELVLPPGTHHTEISFDSISLKSSEKIRLQYRMDGIDPLWLDADSLLTAVYTSIPAGSHQFHVRACNSDGIWDPTGIVYEVTQQPYLYERTWFRLTIVTAFALLLASLYHLRLRQIAHQYNLRLDERVHERTRIARDLHDTLLQSFHGLMLRFQAVRNMLPDRPVQAGESLDVAIDRATAAITEGRDAVHALRSSRSSSMDLVQSLTLLGQELRVQEAAISGDKAPANFRVLVEGAPRDVHPTLLDELYRIAREAVANSFHHSRAKNVEVEIRYALRSLRLCVRDDGIGMNPTVLTEGKRAGHWGLPGMSERAKSIGGKLDVWSGFNQGTEVQLTIPASIAYRGLKHGDE